MLIYKITNGQEADIDLQILTTSFTREQTTNNYLLTINMSWL